MEDEGFICPYPWKWTEIYDRLHRAWMDKVAELKAAAPPPEPEPEPEPAAASGGSDSEFDLDFGEPEAAWDDPVEHIEVELPPIPEPPHMLAPNSTDVMRKQRWSETVAWAEEFGFSHLIPVLSESDKYYAS